MRILYQRFLFEIYPLVLKDQFSNRCGGMGEDMTILSMYDSSYRHYTFEDPLCHMHYAD